MAAYWLTDANVRRKGRDPGDEEEGMRPGARRWRLILSLAVIAGVLLWGVWRSWNFRRWRGAMAEIQEEVEAGRHAAATQKLIAFLAERPDSDEAVYLLGTCQKARGRGPAAAEAWERVPPGSPFADRAIQGRMELEVEAGRFADAEQLIKRAMDDPRFDPSSLPLYLGPVYWLQGRIEEARRSIEVRWVALNKRGEGASEKASVLVRLHIELRQNPRTVEQVRSTLDQAGLSAPKDDRVWLGKANLAIRAGAYDEAERWLDACLRSRPEDVPVWRARLNWAVATNRVAEVREALTHLPAEESTPADASRLAAWLAARRGDRASERLMLERLIADAPADFATIDRLAELAVEQGEPDRAAKLRRRKAELDGFQSRYLKLHQRNQPLRDAAEMTQLADRLGQRFEARIFATLAVAVDPDRDDLRRELARLDGLDRPIDGAGRTLFEVVEKLLGV
jgi:enediyne biosynthesis protein E4